MANLKDTLKQMEEAQKKKEAELKSLHDELSEQDRAIAKLVHERKVQVGLRKTCC